MQIIATVGNFPVVTGKNHGAGKPAVADHTCKICTALGVTLSQFFQEDNSENLTEKQKEVLGIWNDLSTNEQETVMSMLRGLRK